jgi:putative Mg2+ transporter-C (MgtC) family protein
VPILAAILQELSAGLPSPEHLARVAARLITALLLGAAVGFNRERTGKPAGVRTHMLLSLGAALFATTATEYGLSMEGISRVMQGVATGIGFLGAGAILKISARGEIKGLTTAAGIWVTAAVGLACGLGLLGAAILTIVLAWLTLAAMESFSARIAPKHAHYHLKNEEITEEAEE